MLICTLKLFRKGESRTQNGATASGSNKVRPIRPTVTDSVHCSQVSDDILKNIVIIIIGERKEERFIYGYVHLHPNIKKTQ